MSYPVYIQQDLQMARPFQQIGEVQYQQYPSVYYSNQFPQVGQQMSHQIPQQVSQPHPLQIQHMLRMGGNDPFGPFPPYSQNSILAYSQQQLGATSNLSLALKLPQTLLSLVLPLGQMVKPMAAQALQYPLAFLYQQVPLVVGPASYHKGSGYPLSPSSLSSDHKQGEMSDSARSHLHPLQIDYSSLVSYTVLPMSKRRRRTELKANYDSEQVKHTCTKCGKTFQKPYNLKSHMKTHSLERPFKCSVCPKTFARSHDRKRHELLHEGVKNFKCEGYLKDGATKWGCGKKFARSDALARHFRTETGWLCIKPLMDEAKEQEQLNGKYVADPLLLLHHQIALPPLRGQY